MASERYDPNVSPTHWRTLRYFSIYRLVIAALLAIPLYVPSLAFLVLNRGHTATVITVAYLFANVVTLLFVQLYRWRFNRQLGIQVLLDIVALTWLTHVGGGFRSGPEVMLLVMLTGAGLVGQGRLVVFYSALATLATLGEQALRAATGVIDPADIFQAGVFCAGYFAVAISARLLANRIITNEELARQRGEKLRNQMVVSQHIIEEMQDGVLVLDRTGRIKQHNPRIAQLLGLGNPEERQLAAYSTELAENLKAWNVRGGSNPFIVRAPASGLHLRARFIATASSEGDVLVLLEDLGRLQEQARQLKLAALGRLTASIAHEIRNPLSAIKHAGELLREESSDATNERLLRIILDNTQRVERIVADVLEVGRRDRVHRERIDLRSALAQFVEEFSEKGKIPTGVMRTEIAGRGTLLFDRAHFHQVLSNLAGNALRHSRKAGGSVCLRVHDGAGKDEVDLHVIDDGPGVEAAHREQIFEPFFTTHSRGTGLGLYIARELCEANGARLEFTGNTIGADFCLSGRSSE